MSDTPEIVDPSTQTEAELRAEYARLTEAIDTLKAEPPTIETARAINAMRTQRNTIVEHVNQLHALANEGEDIPLIDDAAGSVVTDALAPEGDAPATDAPASDTPEGAAPEVAPAAEATENAPAETTPAVAPAAETTPDATATQPPAEVAPVTAPEPVATATETAPEVVEPGAETPTPHDVTTPSNDGGTPVANTPASQPDPNAADAAAVVAEAEAIAADANLVGSGAPVTAGLAPVHDTRPVVAGLGGAGFERPSVGYIAKGGQNTFAEGTHLDMTALGQVISEIQSAGRDNGSGIVAALPAFDATQGMLHDVISGRLGPVVATAMIDETVEAFKERRRRIINGTLDEIDGVTAAICTPLDIIREVPECGVTDMPFSEVFPQRGVGRGGFQFFPQMALIDTDPNVNVWTEADQDDIDEGDPTTWKPSPLIECLPAISVTAEELVASAQVDNSTQMSQPEQVVQFMHKLAVQRARRREQYLQGKYDALASGYTLTGDYGAMVSLLQVGELLERLVYGERLDEGDYDLVLEPGHMRKLILDEDARVFGDTLASRRANIEAKLRDELGVGRIVVLRDFRTGGGYAALNDPGDAAVEMPRLYDTNRVRLVPASAFIFGATGEDSTGWETDPQLHRMNRMQWFSKEWLLLAKHGCHPAAWVDLTSCASGARANGITPVDCTDQDS